MISRLPPIEDGQDFIRLLLYVGVNRVARMARNEGIRVTRGTVGCYARGLYHHSPYAHDLYDLLKHWERSQTQHPPLPRPTPKSG